MQRRYCSIQKPLLWPGLMQRLYRSIQKALARVYIYEAGKLGKEGSWVLYEGPHHTRSAVATGDVPGPAPATLAAASAGARGTPPSSTRPDEPTPPKARCLPVALLSRTREWF